MDDKLLLFIKRNYIKIKSDVLRGDQSVLISRNAITSEYEYINLDKNPKYTFTNLVEEKSTVIIKEKEFEINSQIGLQEFVFIYKLNNSIMKSAHSLISFIDENPYNKSPKALKDYLNHSNAVIKSNYNDILNFFIDSIQKEEHAEAYYDLSSFILNLIKYNDVDLEDKRLFAIINWLAAIYPEMNKLNHHLFEKEILKQEKLSKKKPKKSKKEKTNKVKKDSLIKEFKENYDSNQLSLSISFDNWVPDSIHSQKKYYKKYIMLYSIICLFLISSLFIIPKNLALIFFIVFILIFSFAAILVLNIFAYTKISNIRTNENTLIVESGLNDVIIIEEFKFKYLTNTYKASQNPWDIYDMLFDNNAEYYYKYREEGINFISEFFPKPDQ